MILLCDGKAPIKTCLSANSKSAKTNPGATVQPASTNVLLVAGSAANHTVAELQTEMFPLPLYSRQLYTIILSVTFN